MPKIIGLELTVFPAGRGEGLETELNQHPKMYSSIHADVMKRSPNTYDRVQKGPWLRLVNTLRCWEEMSVEKDHGCSFSVPPPHHYLGYAPLFHLAV